MQGNHFTITIHVPGTLTANVVPVFSMPFDACLEKVIAVASNASSATIKAGTTADDDAYLVASDVGDSSVPSTYERDDFVSTEYPHISKDTVMQVTVDYDGAAGTAAQNLTVVLVFSEG